MDKTFMIAFTILFILILFVLLIMTFFEEVNEEVK